MNNRIKKRCTMNCGLAKGDTRTREQMMENCSDCDVLTEPESNIEAMIRRITELESKIQSAKKLLSDDAFAMSFQSLGQYRTALIDQWNTDQISGGFAPQYKFALAKGTSFNDRLWNVLGEIWNLVSFPLDEPMRAQARHQIMLLMNEISPLINQQPLKTLIAQNEGLQKENERLFDAGKKALDAMELAKKLLKSAGFTMEGGTISAPYSDAMDSLRKALEGGVTMIGESGFMPAQKITTEDSAQPNKEGWTWLHNSTKWHYFRDGKSLCKRFMLLRRPSEGYRQDDVESPDNCTLCKQRFLKEKGGAA